MKDKEFEMNAPEEQQPQIFNRAIFNKRKMWQLSDKEVNDFLQKIDSTVLFTRFILENQDQQGQLSNQLRGVEYQLESREKRFMPFTNPAWVAYCYELGNVEIGDELKAIIRTVTELSTENNRLRAMVESVINIVMGEGQSFRGQINKLTDLINKTLEIQKHG